MTILLHDHPQDVTLEELTQDLLLLPVWRQKKVLAFHFHLDRVLCTKAYLMLLEGLKSEFGITDKQEFAYHRHGKPFLENHPTIHFNLSHCPKGVLCVIDQQNIGCDIEEIANHLDEDLCHHCFSESEIADILSAPSPNERFTVWWTRKEAYIKLTGTGLVDNLPTLLTPEVMSMVKFVTTIDTDRGYIYTICSYL